MSLILEVFDIRRVSAYNPKNLKEFPNVKIDSKELIGIEVEVENVATRDALNAVWMVKEDGSLRNSGSEFVTHPIEAHYAPAALQHLMKEALDPQCHFSPRTSVHIHLNVQDMDTSQVIDLVLLYSVYEKILYRFAGRGRIKNIYCVPIVETALMRWFLERGMNDQWSKYTGLNLCTLRNFGTLEFRHMHGTFDVEKLSNWIGMITSLKEYVKSSTSKEIRQMVQSMDDSFDFKGLLHKIFGQYAELLKYRDVSDVHNNYLAAKLSFARLVVFNKLRSQLVNESPFFKRIK